MRRHQKALLLLLAGVVGGLVAIGTQTHIGAEPVLAGSLGGLLGAALATVAKLNT